jgi:hypothetical protein
MGQRPPGFMAWHRRARGSGSLVGHWRSLSIAVLIHYRPGPCRPDILLSGDFIWSVDALNAQKRVFLQSKPLIFFVPGKEFG